MRAMTLLAGLWAAPLLLLGGCSAGPEVSASVRAGSDGVSVTPRLSGRMGGVGVVLSR